MMKVIAVFLDLWLEKMVEEALVFAPLQIFYGLICGLVTFGSDDFLAFVDGYFVEFGIMIYERTYNEDVVGFV
jgi:hypothetical protein